MTNEEKYIRRLHRKHQDVSQLGEVLYCDSRNENWDVLYAIGKRNTGHVFFNDPKINVGDSVELSGYVYIVVDKDVSLVKVNNVPYSSRSSFLVVRIDSRLMNRKIRLERITKKLHR